MAVSPTYPGVYIAETTAVPHVVTPATTNFLAVIGEFPQGSTTEAVFVTSWPQFQAEFGQLNSTSSYAAYAVLQFFLNGGIAAWITRLPVTGNLAASATIAPGADPTAALLISANSPGAWATGYTVGFQASTTAAGASTTHADFVVGPPVVAASPPAAPGPAFETLKNLQVVQSDGTPVPATVLAQRISQASNFVTAVAATPASPPTHATATGVLGGGADGAWTDAGLIDAITAELQPGARLDQLAPNVFNLLCIPDVSLLSISNQTSVVAAAVEFAEKRQAFVLVDPPPPAAVDPDAPITVDSIGVGTSGMTDLVTTWGAEFLTQANVAAATYYPWVQISDPVTALPRFVPPSGTVAGVYAATDTARGVWKAPAGVEATLAGVSALADTTITDLVNGELNVLGINCLRTFPLYGPIVWGSRTLAGSDLGGSAFTYVPVRRLTDFIEQSLQQSLRWAVFEPNGPALWSSISLEVTGFMAGLFAAGAFAGSSAAQAYSVACDATTTSPTNMLEGIVNVNVAFAPVDPAEFVMLNIKIDAASAAS